MAEEEQVTMQVKMFFAVGASGFANIERSINAWLSENSAVEIVDRHVCGARCGEMKAEEKDCLAVAIWFRPQK